MCVGGRWWAAFLLFEEEVDGVFLFDRHGRAGAYGVYIERFQKGLLFFGAVKIRNSRPLVIIKKKRKLLLLGSDATTGASVTERGKKGRGKSVTI